MVAKHYLRDLRSDAQALLKERGHWLVAAVETQIFWPETIQVFPYDGKDLILRPGDDKLVPTIAFNFSKHGMTREEARDLLSNFASALAWMEKKRLEITNWTGGGHPINVMHGRTRNVSRFLDPEMLEVPATETESAALALYREAISTRNPFYAFLNFYKVIAFTHRDGRERGRWIRGALAELTAGAGFERFNALTVEYGDKVDEYLVSEGRHAIAHAEKEIFVNPDKIRDHQRILEDLPLMRCLAELSIERDHGFVTDLYAKKYADPIAGFRAMMTEAIIGKILEAKFAPEDVLEVPDQVTIVARNEGSAAVLSAMQFEQMGLWINGISLVFVDATESVFLQINLDFRENKMILDPLSGVTIVSRRETVAQLDAQIAGLEFVMAAFCNGPLEVWNDMDDSMLGRAKGYIPLNLYADINGHRIQIEKLNALRRELSEQSQNIEQFPGHLSM
jgi:hypothetical protein